MTAAALLVCVTIVTNGAHSSVASNTCHYEQPAVAIATVIAPVADVEEPTVPAVVTTVKPVHRKLAHHRGTAKPVMTAEQNRAYRHLWFRRLAEK